MYTQQKLKAIRGTIKVENFIIFWQIAQNAQYFALHRSTVHALLIVNVVSCNNQCYSSFYESG